MDPVSVEHALALVSRVGEFFDPAVSTPAAQGWRPLRDLVTDPAAVRRRVAFLGGQLAGGADVEARVAASLDLLGVAARLVSPSLAAAALCGVVPVLDLDAVWWRDAAAPFAAGVPDRAALAGVTVDSAREAAAALERHLVGPVLLPLVDAYAGVSGVARGLLLGNLASSFAGAATVLGATDEPLQTAPVSIVEALVARGALAGAGRYETPFADPPASFFVRNSCCLFYRVPGGDTCADCALVTGPRRLAGWRAAVARASS